MEVSKKPLDRTKEKVETKNYVQRYTGTVWCWHLTEQHQHLHESKCQTTLFVSPLYGAAIECTTTFISRLVALESDSWNANVSMAVNSITTVLLVFFCK